jgi:hypothetical protein
MNRVNDPNAKAKPRARRLACGISLLALCLGLTACQTPGSNPFSSRVNLSYEASQTGEDQRKSLNVTGESGMLADDVSKISAEYSLETAPDGTSKLTIKLNGDKTTDTGNQFRALDSIIGFLAGLFASGVAP